MGISPGEVVAGCGTIETRDRTDAVEPGDAVQIDGSSAIAPAADGDTFVGVAGKNGLVLDGVVVASVDTDDADGAVTEGTSLSLSPDAGELYRAYETDVDGNVTGYLSGPATALCDEGGTWQGKDVPAGYAVVRLDFHY